jgi:N-acyl-D-aspartate/D-glutamate deacylase
MVFPSLVPSLGVSAEAWRRRSEVWNDPRVLLGGSDSGAHVDLMCHANYPTVVLGEMVRDREVFTMEEAVRRMTDMPARLLGLRERGQVRAGWHADLVVFDATTVASLPARSVDDLPGGAVRLTADAVGIEHVLVGGRSVVRAGKMTGATAGRVLRSGTDTETVSVPGGVR